MRPIDEKSAGTLAAYPHGLLRGQRQARSTSREPGGSAIRVLRAFLGCLLRRRRRSRGGGVLARPLLVLPCAGGRHPLPFVFLSIPILEFLGAAFNVLTFYPHLHCMGSASSPAWVDLYTDAFTTARVLAAESAKSTVIVEAYQHLIASPEWRALYGRLRVAHLYGDANVLADLISRARWAEFRQLCANFVSSVRPQLVATPAGVSALYRAVIRCLRERAHLGSTARGVFNHHLIGDQPIAHRQRSRLGPPCESRGGRDRGGGGALEDTSAHRSPKRSPLQRSSGRSEHAVLGRTEGATHAPCSGVWKMRKSTFLLGLRERMCQEHRGEP